MLDWYKGQDIAESFVGKCATRHVSRVARELPGMEFTDLCDALDVIYRERARRMIVVDHIGEELTPKDIREIFTGAGVVSVSSIYRSKIGPGYAHV
jgi:hypothetical protein